MVTHINKLAGICGILFLSVLSIHCASSSSEEPELADIYLSLRELALTNAAEAEPKNGVLCMLMEFYIDNEVVTLMAAADGSTSLYFGNGGGRIGMGELDEVREKTLEALEEAGTYTENMEVVGEYPLPEKNKTRFYVVTPTEVRTVEIPDEDLTQNKSSFSPLYMKGQDILTAIRTSAEGI